MPFYEYECQSCKFYSEVMQKITDAPLRKCPSCGKNELKKLVSAPVFRLKGSGWYETDFKSDQEHKRNLAAAEKEEPKSESKAESKEEAKPAPAAKADAAPAVSTPKAAPAKAGRGAARPATGKTAAKAPARGRKSAPPARARPRARPAARKGRR